MRIGFATLVVALAAVPGTALAQKDAKPIALSATATYVHKPTGLSVPATLDGMPRKEAKALEDEPLDDYLNYTSDDGRDDITVYVFRHVTGSVPVWFDRVRRTVEARNDTYGELAPLAPPAAFTPPGQANASGLMQVWRTGKGPFRSTALAFLPLGPGWYVAVRYSAGNYSADALAPRVNAVLAELGWPAKIKAQPDAAPIADCAAPLVFTGPAKQLKAKTQDAMMGSLFAAIAANPQTEKKDGEANAEEEATKSLVWCRDSGAVADSSYNIYRADASTTDYLIAFGDAGRGVTAGVDIMGALLGGKGKPRYNVTLVSMTQSTVFAPLDRLPPPDQAIAIVNSGKPISSATTWGQSNITINSSAIK